MTAGAHQPFPSWVTIVTGSAASLGQVIVEMPAERGASIAIANQDDTAAELEREPGSGNGEAVAVETGVTVAVLVEGMIGRTVERYRRIDFLVNNAGMLGPIYPLRETTEVLELALYRARVNAIAPRYIDTLLTWRRAAEVRKSITETTPLSRFDEPRKLIRPGCSSPPMPRVSSPNRSVVEGGWTAR